MNYYRRYSRDYLGDTPRLTLTEHGAYCLMLDYYYTAEEPLPADRDEIYLMVRAMRPEDRRAVDKVLDAFFDLEDDGYHQKRADEEIRVSRQARTNGEFGGRKRRGKTTGDGHGGTESGTDETSGEITETGTGNATDGATDAVTGAVTGTVTGEATERGGGSGHPPTTNHQPPASNLQPPGVKRRAAASARAREAPEKSPGEAGPDPEPLPQPSAAAALAVDLRKAGIACTSADPRLLEILASDPARRHIDDAIGLARMRKPGESIAIGYLAAIHRDCITRAQRPTATEVRPSSADDLLERNLAVARRVAATLAGGRQP